ncbi:MAG: hypothetical protein KDK26_15760 [Roseivivax sp.]|nr:hypothetical protein [Roseivivax sp.]
MPNRAANITQAELTRYARAFKAAGVASWRVVVRVNGEHEISVGDAPSADDGASQIDDLLGMS